MSGVTLLKRYHFFSVLFIWLSVGAVALMTMGCEDKDQNAVAQAQDCLDKARTTDQAAACRTYVEGKSSQQAYIVRCSIEFVAGGLTTSKVANAYKALKNTSSSNKEAQLITLLSLKANTPDESKSIADNAAAYCKLSGIPGLIYLSGLSLIGTYMAATLSNLDINDPNTATQLLNNCISGNCNDTAIGTAVISIADSYCKGDNATSDVCSKINQTLATTDGSPTAVANALYSQLNH